jgi:hypothetical protein
VFLLYRWIIASFFAFSVVNSIVVNVVRGHFSTYFIFLTHLNLNLTMATMIFGAVLVTLHHFDKLNIEKEMPASLKIYWAMWNQSIVVACIVSSLYWGLLYKGQPIDPNNVFIHVTNSILLCIDLFISKIPPSFKISIFPVVFEVLYAIFTIVYQFAGGLDM